MASFLLKQHLHRALHGLRQPLDVGISLLKLLLRSRWTPPRPEADTAKPALLLGNGPSAAVLLESHAHGLNEHYEPWCVNWFAHSPHYAALQPRHYVLHDPSFWMPGFAPRHEAAVRQLMQHLAQSTHWPLQVHVPYGGLKSPLLAPLRARANIRLVPYNLVRANGWPGFVHAATRRGLGVPMVHNVLCMAVLLAQRSGCPEAYLMGAENDMARYLFVDEHNKVWVQNNRFDGAAPQPANEPMAAILPRLTRALVSFEGIARYCAAQGFRVVNSTPRGWLDVFERGPLPWPPPRTDSLPGSGPGAPVGA